MSTDQQDWLSESCHYLQSIGMLMSFEILLIMLKLWKISSHFGSTGRKVAKILRSVPKDYTINQTIQDQLRDLKLEDLKKSDVKISDAFKRGTKKQIHFIKPPSDKLSAFIKEELKNAIDYGMDDEAEKLRLEVEDKTLKWRENRLMASEAEKFKKILFKKNEILRLIKQEEKRPQNYLPTAELEKEPEYLKLNRQHSEYKANLSGLNNVRISNAINNQPEDAYSFLVKSQLLSQFPEARELIQRQIGQLSSPRPSQIISVDNQIIDDFLHQVKSQVNLNSAIIDWEALKEFYERLVTQHSKTLEQFHNSEQKVTAIQEYSERLFDQFYNQQLSLRVKGQITFDDLTEEECIRYVKLDIHDSEVALRLVDSIDRQKISPQVTSAIVQKLAVIRYPSPQDKLKIISDNRFHVLLKLLATMDFEDQTLCQTLLALSMLHPKSILTLYEGLSVHLYRNLTSQLLAKLPNLSNGNFAMAVRNLCFLPISKDFAFQRAIQVEIKKRNQLTVYEAESFLRFMGFVRDPYAKDLLAKVFTAPNSECEIDSNTIMIFGQSLLRIKDKNDLKQIIDDNLQKLVQAITECQTNHLAPFTLLLAELGYNKTHPIVRQIKKRVIQIIAFKKDIQDESDLTNTFAGLVQIDIKNIYSCTNKVNEIVLLQTIFGRLPFRLKSSYHTPYSKLLDMIQRYLGSFQEHNLIIILHSVISISHLNINFINTMIDKVLNAQYLFPAYLALQKIDHTFDKLVYKFEQQKDEELTLQGIIYYLWALFYLNQLNLKNFEILKKNNFIDKLGTLDAINQAIMAVLFSTNRQLKDLQLLLDQPIAAANSSQELLYLINLTSPDAHMSADFEAFMLHQREIRDQRNKEIGVENLPPHKVRQQVIEHLEVKGYNVIPDNVSPQFLADFYLPEKDMNFSFISVNEMLFNEQSKKFVKNGVQMFLQKKFKLNFIIYEEWLRSDNKSEYLSQFKI